MKTLKRKFTLMFKSATPKLNCYATYLTVRKYFAIWRYVGKLQSADELSFTTARMISSGAHNPLSNQSQLSPNGDLTSRGRFVTSFENTLYNYLYNLAQK